MNVLDFSDIVTALNTETIGTKIVNRVGFFRAALDAIDATDFSTQRVPGQAFIPFKALDTLSAGVGKKSDNPADYILRVHRGEVQPFLRREAAAPIEGAAIIVYTREAYLADPDVAGNAAEVERVTRTNEATHVLVAVLGFAGPKAPLSPVRLVANLAGGNKEALVWGADEIRQKAAESDEYWKEWCVVAD